MTGEDAGASWRSNGKRWCKFSLVGAMGMVVQLGTLTLLTAAGVEYLLATAVGVEAAVLHNFAWHQNFTWKDREGRILGRLGRFHLSNGAISIGGNMALMRLLVGYWGLPVMPANLVSVAVCWLANFLAADRMVFLGRGFPEADGARCSAVPDGTLVRQARPPATEVAGYFLGVLNKTREYSQIPGTSVLGFTVSPLSGWFQPRHRVCATSIRVSPGRLSPDESGQDPTHAGGGARATKNSAAGAGVGFAHEQDSAL